MKQTPLLLGCVLSVACFAASPQPAAVHLHLIGDSTMAAKAPERRPETGWGEKLPDFFSAAVQIHNHAINGRSSRSFRAEGHWQKVLDQLRPGDYVLIQFGHNDEKVEDPARFTNPYGSYRYYLQRYVEESRARGATPILLSSVVRRNFNAQGSLVDTHGPYPAVVRELATALGVDFVDMNTLSEMLVAGLGAEHSRDLYLHLNAGANPNYPAGVDDDTHLRPAGASAFAQLAASAFCQQGLALRRYLLDC